MARSDVHLHKAIVTGAEAPGLFTLVQATEAACLQAQTVPPPALALSRPQGGHGGLLLRTSGTTSKPKGVPLRQRALLTNAHCLAASLGLSAEDVCLNTMPLYHIGGISASLLSSRMLVRSEPSSLTMPLARHVRCPLCVADALRFERPCSQ